VRLLAYQPRGYPGLVVLATEKLGHYWYNTLPK